MSKPLGDNTTSSDKRFVPTNPSRGFRVILQPRPPLRHGPIPLDENRVAKHGDTSFGLQASSRQNDPFRLMLYPNGMSINSIALEGLSKSL